MLLSSFPLTLGPPCRRGIIEVMDVALESWRLLLRWQAHKGKVLQLFLDTRSIWSAGSIRVVSSGEDDTIRFWDGLLATDWKRRILAKREEEFSTYSTLKIAHLTYNLGGAGPRRLRRSLNPSSHNLLHDFLVSADRPDIVSFGFQEVIDLGDVSLAAQGILFGSDKHDCTPRYHKWLVSLTAAVREHLGVEYVLVKDGHLVGVSSPACMVPTGGTSLTPLRLAPVSSTAASLPGARCSGASRILP